jgi:predicted O-methyltransferase YrrM
MLARPARAPIRQALRQQWPWILYGALLLLILGTAALLRYRIPRTPLIDRDSWGYFGPAFLKLTGGFKHGFGRNFVYPDFLFLVMCVFGDYEAVCVCQHALGLLTGVLLAVAWNVLCDFLAVSARVRMAARFLGLVLVAEYLFSRSPLLFEHTLRPEAVFPFFLALSFVLNFGALHAWFVVPRPAVARWCLGLNFVVVCVAQSLKPSTGFGVLAANVPLAFWLLRGGAAWREKARVTGAAVGVAAVTLWLPAWLLTRGDPEAMTFLPTMLFTIHARIIHQQILDDLRNGRTAPYAPAWLEAFNRHLERSLDAAALPANNPWPTIGFNADYLIYRDSIFHPAFGRGMERGIAAFCDRYYWRTWLHRPRAMLGAVAAELGVVYLPPRYIRFALVSINDPYTGKVQRPLAYDYRESWETARRLRSQLLRSQYGVVYLRRLGSLRHTHAVARQFPWIGYLNNGLTLLRLPLLALALLCGIPLLSRPETRVLVGAVWLCLLVDFSIYLTVAVAHTLDIDRYVQNQRVCTVFGEFAVVLLPWQLLRRKAEKRSPTPTGPPILTPAWDAPSLPLSPCLALGQALVESRRLAVYPRLRAIGEKYSMLHLDVLTLLYHFGREARGGILEIGPYLGGSTIALALGAQDAGRGVPLTTVEAGGSHPTHHRLPSEDILRDLKVNLAAEGVAGFVTLLEGRSDEPAIIAQVRDRHGPGSIGLFFIDADGGVERDLSTYQTLLSEDCLLVIDDYLAPGSDKAGPTRAGIDALVADGRAEPLGVYGWGTWIGRRVPVL